MKLASLKSESLDGELVVVSRDLKRAIKATGVAKTMQEALDNWGQNEAKLRKIYQSMDEASATFDLNLENCSAPLPRAYQWLDGSAYVHHVELARKSRGAEMPESFWRDPLMYQGASDKFIPWNSSVTLIDPSWGYDFEAELAIICKDTPQGVSKSEAEQFIACFMLLNDLSLRSLVAPELSKGFGFVQSKPHCSCAPVLVTVDELGKAWSENKVHLSLVTNYNHQEFGRPNAGDDMVFDFADLMVHAAKTRPLAAGTVIGSGTIANRNPEVGSSCLVERRMLEKISNGEVKTEYLKKGDHIQMEMFHEDGSSLFGTIEQSVIEGE